MSASLEGTYNEKKRKKKKNKKNNHLVLYMHTDGRSVFQIIFKRSKGTAAQIDKIKKYL